MTDTIPPYGIPGIYKIACKTTGRIYIGSAVNLSRRWNKHRHELRHNIHCNPKLQNAWNKYTEDDFTFEILELVLIPEFLTAREQYWFRRLNPFGRNGFNILKVASSALGHPSPNRGKCGKPHTPEARAKISAALLGNTYTLGKKASESTRKKQSITHLGKKQSEEHIRKRAERRRGSIPSPETRAKIGAANKGRKPTPESIEKRRQANIAAGQRRRSGEYDQSS